MQDWIAHHNLGPFHAGMLLLALGSISIGLLWRHW